MYTKFLDLDVRAPGPPLVRRAAHAKPRREGRAQGAGVAPDATDNRHPLPLGAALDGDRRKPALCGGYQET